MDLKSVVDLASRIASLPDDRPEWLQKFQEVRTEQGLYYKFLYKLAVWMKPAAVLELGTRHGYSIAQIAVGHPEAEIVTVDIEPQSKARFSKDPHLKTLTNVTPITGNSLKVKDEVVPILPELDLLYIDTDHTYDQAKAEFELYAPLVKSGGLVLFDDIQLFAGMKKFWSEVPQPKAELNHLHRTENAGFGVHIRP